MSNKLKLKMKQMPKREPVANKIQASYIRGYREGRKEGIDLAVTHYSIALSYVMHTKMLYGEKKIATTLKQIADIYDKINKDEVSIEDLRKELAEEAGIKFVQ